jgi:energy-coupling factor transport system substrate-specific component
VRELRDMWQDTRMVVFTAISAALYAAILIPFKVMPIIPGITEFRPANAVPVICSLLFGPAAAWGSAIGNLIGDLFGGIGPGDMFGFAGNFLYGLVPYRAWEALGGGDPTPRSLVEWLRLLFVVLLAAAACALVVGWGLNALGFVPFPVLGNVVLWNNVVAAGVLGPLTLRVLYPRVKSGGLLYTDMMLQRPKRRSGTRSLVLATASALTFGGHVAGNLIYAGYWMPPWVRPFGIVTPSRAFEIGVGLAPFVVGAFACFLAL